MRNTGTAIRLRKARSERGLTQLALANLAKTTQVSIHRIEAGESKGTRIIKDIAQALDVSPSWLLFGESDNSNDMRDNFYYIPVIDWKHAGNGILSDKELLKKLKHVALPKKVCSENSYALSVKGDSMDSPLSGKKSFRAGETIVVDTSKTPKSSCYVLALINNNSEVIFRQYFEEGPHKYLKPLNPHYPNLKMKKGMKIVGVIVGHYDYEL